MVAVYVVGVPLMYFLMLWYNRDEIAARDDVIATVEVGTQTSDLFEVPILSYCLFMSYIFLCNVFLS
jgi:hypothetical protein